MRRILFAQTFLLLFQMSLIAQENNILFYGEIENSQSDTILLSNHYGKYIAVSDLNGQFKFDLNIESPDFLNFQIDDIQLTIFLLAGDTMEMSFDKNMSGRPNDPNFAWKNFTELVNAGDEDALQVLKAMDDLYREKFPTPVLRPVSEQFGVSYAKGGKFPDLNKDGKITMADILKGRGVKGSYGMGGKVKRFKNIRRWKDRDARMGYLQPTELTCSEMVADGDLPEGDTRFDLEMGPRKGRQNDARFWQAVEDAEAFWDH